MIKSHVLYQLSYGLGAPSTKAARTIGGGRCGGKGQKLWAETLAKKVFQAAFAWERIRELSIVLH